jgi:eukaryotic-like serine/threonine-protein kinase
MTGWTLPGHTELQRLGEGAYGRVVLARHDASSQVVAVKYLFDRHLADDTARAQFRHEAAILRLVVSPNVARLYDFVESEHGAAIVMEAVPGVSLREILREHGPLPPEAALTVLKGSLLGLHAAHVAGAVHRDYKPGNVLVQPNQQSKLVDFGIAMLTGHSGQSGGTPAYMAPEQWAGAPATPATDVYAASCVLFHCLTGKRPYDATETEQLRQLHQHAPVPLDQLPEPLRPLLAHGMAKDPAARPRSAEAFVAELERLARKAYGKAWERTGWRRLAESAGALLAVSPMAWVVSTSGVLAGTGGAAALGGTGAAVGGGAALGGTGAAVGGGTALGGTAVGGTTAAAVGKTASVAVLTKIAAAVVGVAVVVGATIVVINETTGDDPPAPPTTEQPALAVATERITERYPEVELTVTADVPVVSGLPDANRQAQVNRELRAPVDDRIAELREFLAGIQEPGGGTTTLTVTPHLTMRGPNFVSVRYENGFESDYMTTSSWDDVRTTTVDLHSGTIVGTRDVFRADPLDQHDLALLAQTLETRADGGICDGADAGPPHLTLTEADIGDAVLAAFGPETIEFSLALERIGYANFCSTQSVAVPYDDIAELLDTQLVVELTS